MRKQRKPKPSKPKPKSVKETLQRAYNIIRDKNRWTTNELAVDSKGDGCDPTGDDAVAFCALGVLQYVDGPFERNAITKLQTACEKLYSITSIPTVNDANYLFDGRRAILKAFRHAIKECR